MQVKGLKSSKNEFMACGPYGRHQIFNKEVVPYGCQLPAPVYKKEVSVLEFTQPNAKLYFKPTNVGGVGL